MSRHKILVITAGTVAASVGLELIKQIKQRDEDLTVPVAVDAARCVGLELIKQRDETWDALYDLLMPVVRNWVYHAEVSSWRGRESDIARDIVQAAMRKIFGYALNAQQHGITIASLERLSIVIARNYLRDQLRKDGGTVHIERDADAPEVENTTVYHYQENDLVKDILRSSRGSGSSAESRKRLSSSRGKLVLRYSQTKLYDWRKRVTLRRPPGPAAPGPSREGVHLEGFIGLLLVDSAARARHSALVSLAITRIAKIVQCRSDVIYAAALLQGNGIRKDGSHEYAMCRC